MAHNEMDAASFSTSGHAAPSHANVQSMQAASSSSSSSSASVVVETDRHAKRKEQNRLAQRRHRAKARRGDSDVWKETVIEGAATGPSASFDASTMTTIDLQSQPLAAAAGTGGGGGGGGGTGPWSSFSAVFPSSESAGLKLTSTPSSSKQEVSMPVPDGIAQPNHDWSRFSEIRSNEDDSGAGEDNKAWFNGGAPATSASFTPFAPSALVPQSETIRASPPNGQHQREKASSQERAAQLSDLVTTASLQSAWVHRLLGPKWDMMKVLHSACSRLGLEFNYVDDDASISFLATDFEQQVVLNRMQIHHPSGQTTTTFQMAPVMLNPNGMVTNGSSAHSGMPSNQNALAPLLRWHDWPENMQPSSLSGLVSHHPFIDLSFPWPNVRDRILAAISSGILDEHVFCETIWPGPDYQIQGADPPYWVHGDDPLDPEAYEVSDRFIERFPWLLEPSIIRRTNWWRRQQNKPELSRNVLRAVAAFSPFLSQQKAHLLSPKDVAAPHFAPPDPSAARFTDLA